ncbi:MAG: BACON domain-containing protein [Bacteroidales bacterium]|nr:BACON domain-containing protein [Bacteroidales bacterium]
MKKIFKAILSLTAVLSLFSSCKDEDINLGSRVSISQTEDLSIPAEQAGQFAFTVESDGDWLVVAPSWITPSPRHGSGDGTIILEFADNVTYVTDEAGEVISELNGSRHATVSVECASGATSFIVRQAGDPNKPSDEIKPVTIAVFLAQPDGPQVFELTGRVTSIKNTTYGNLYLNDGTGEVYIYGILDKNGNAKNFSSLGIGVGDLLTLQGSKTTYNGTVESVNAQYISHVKSLVSLAESTKSIPADETVFTVGVEYSGDDITVVSDSEWLAFTGISTADGTALCFKAAANTGSARSANVTVTSTLGNETSSQTLKVNQAAGGSTPPGGDVLTVTVAEFNAAAESDTQKYCLTGTISGTINTTYGNFDLVDDSGTVYVYGLTSTELGYGASNDKSFASLGLAAGDKITIVGYRGSYNSKIEVMYAYFISKQ